jgi:hypothetical protein
MPTIAGVEVPREQILELALVLARNRADFASRLLLDSITYRREIVSFNGDDREHLLEAIDSLSTDLGGLRNALIRDGAIAA